MSLIYFFMGIGLSMDAFSLSLSIGTTNPSKRNIIKTSLIVGIFHFIMPIIGYILRLYLNTKIGKVNYLSSILFLILAIETYINRNEEERSILTNINILLIAISVSIDSLTVGLALGLNNELIYHASTIFSIISSIFTYLGLTLGKRLRNKYKKLSNYIGIIILILLSLKYLINV